MKATTRHFTILLAVVGLAAAQSAASRSALKHASPPATSGEAPELQIQARTIHYADKDVVRLKTRVRYTTLIILPKNEQILDFTCGDKDFWVVNGNANFAYIKPAKTGSQTDLNLITASGNIYSFVLTEISDLPGAVPDLKVFVELKDESMITATNTAPRFVPAQVADDYRQQVAVARQETKQVEQSSQAEIDRGITRFIGNMRFPYRFEAGKKPFFVRAMYNDDKFTYIQARPEETPALYEIQDGQPNLVNFEYRNGVYVVGKILDRGYLAIGKQKLSFARAE
jgi:type IV secretory pathway VirB9-like protein